MRRLALPVSALVLAATTAWFARSWIENRRPTAEATAGVMQAPVILKAVLVAASDLEPGSFIQPTNMAWQTWPDVELPASYVVKGQRTSDELVGAVVRHRIGRGQPIADGSIVKPGDRSFLAVVLAPGMRALSVPIDEASGNAGLIFPGDRVDLILTQTLAAGEEQSARASTATRRVSETVLSDVRVIAIGRRLTGASKDDTAGSGAARTATLELTPAGAERVALVTELGKLSLSLRSLAMPQDGLHAAEQPAPPRATWDKDVSQALGQSPALPDKVLVFRGSAPAVVAATAAKSKE